MRTLTLAALLLAAVGMVGCMANKEPSTAKCQSATELKDTPGFTVPDGWKVRISKRNNPAYPNYIDDEEF